MKLVVIYTDKNLSVKEYLNETKSFFRDKVIKYIDSGIQFNNKQQ